MLASGYEVSSDDGLKEATLRRASLRVRVCRQKAQASQAADESERAAAQQHEQRTRQAYVVIGAAATQYRTVKKLAELASTTGIGLREYGNLGKKEAENLRQQEFMAHGVLRLCKEQREIKRQRDELVEKLHDEMRAAAQPDD